jgi:arsenate reductase
MTAHWGIPDPAAVEGAAQSEAFREAFNALSYRISRLLSLPLDRLDGASLQHRLREIGRVQADAG